ncbi:hypothetical protein MA16_Dca020717 [Dendrobium catenatum]|uniref:Uncharacterized protein n=1 Tax=Dendrobium catenatum TaxID=906689 RepID=A0A2I0WIU1_9ASPA|nr:hypothetical protein MA16_Dca020717 [Dendrobium catenatum]
MEDNVCEILIKKPRPTTATSAATSSVTRDSDEGSHEPGANESLLYIINLILSATARLNVLLPAATTLAFSIFTALLTNDGDCSSLNRYLMASVLLCAASCAFFAISDSFRTASGRACFGVAKLYRKKSLCGL